MMQVDPPTGLRYRVARRLHRGRAQRSFVAAFTAAAVVIAIVGSWMVLRGRYSAPTVAPHHALAPQAQPQIPAGASPTSAAVTTAATQAAANDTPPVATRPRGIPRPTVVFTGAPDRVSAASVPAAAPPPSAVDLPPADAAQGVMPGLPPITIAPITVPPIVITPLRVSPITDRK